MDAREWYFQEGYLIFNALLINLRDLKHSSSVLLENLSIVPDGVAIGEVVLLLRHDGIKIRELDQYHELILK